MELPKRRVNLNYILSDRRFGRKASIYLQAVPQSNKTYNAMVL